MEGNQSIIKLFVFWWYGEEASYFLAYIKKFFLYLSDQFSVKTCFRTLLAPWKRDRISTDGLAIGDRFNVWMLNLTARFVGMAIKLFTIFTFCILAAICLVISFIIIAAYFTYPLVIIALLYLGVKSLLS